VGGGDRELAVHLAVPVLDHPEHRRRLGVLLLALQLLRLVGVRGLGIDHGVDPLPQHPQALGVMDTDLVQQSGLGLRFHPGFGVLGERIHSLHDHPGLVRQHRTRRERLADRFVSLGVQGLRELHLAVRLAPGLPGLHRPPRCSARGTRLVADLARLGVRGHPQLQLAPPPQQPGQPDQDGPGRLIGHRPRRLITHGVEELLDLGDSNLDRVAPVDGRCGAAHDTYPSTRHRH